MSRIFGPTRQLGLVVRDFDATLRHWTQVQDVGPFWFFRDMPVQDFRYRGQQAEPPIVSIAFGYTGDLQIEIIHQQNDAPSIYREFLDSGREGLQHISGFTDRPGYDRIHAEAIASGLSVVHEGSIGGTRFAYFDTESLPGAVTCEISESDMPGPRELFEGMRLAAASWDGSDPLRPLGVQ
ncbi:MULTISPECIES: VOC family protein [Sphingobium]|uniref:VOC family protein n=1 Tax=Sphingobium sp. MI1205 TaxID=407020 RepID=UPI0007702A8B|nr:VOC family protein [Sphingobium sp. MI1205]AMK19935.1 hypothetical protein K663_17871 [Sphingobium sp. MI1205]